MAGTKADVRKFPKNTNDALSELCDTRESGFPFPLLAHDLEGFFAFLAHAMIRT